MNIPFQASHFIVYEAMQKLTNEKGEYNPASHIVSGGMAGAVAAIVTMPLDVCKTLLNTQEAGVLKVLNTGKVVGMVRAAKTVYNLAGFSGYFQGVRARVLYQVPATAIAWSVYEFFKHFLTMGAREQQSLEKYESLADLPDRYKTVHAVNSPLPASKGEASGVDANEEENDGKLFDMITDIPRKVRNRSDLQAESSRELVQLDSWTFPPRFRTD
jgi:hypothetical protein